MIKLHGIDTTGELAKSLFYAHDTAMVMRSKNHRSPSDWSSLHIANRQFWLDVAERLMGTHSPGFKGFE